MNKLKMESMDMTQYNIDKIAEMFPQVVTEVVDPSGAVDAEGKPLLKKAVDFEKLKLVLSAGTGDYVVADDERERYEFTWVGKRQAMIDAATPIRKTLRPCPEESVNFDTTENMYIEGDNLEVLKLLQESYLGKIKMIYIDPPYNTGGDFVYKDNFSQSTDEYMDESGVYDEEDNRLFQNTETNGRFHSDWCTMIYPRLQLARNLLTDDGVIFISIDDNEVENLKKICDEIFGASNFIADIIRNTNSSKNQSLFVSVSHEYCLVYARDIETMKIKHSENKWSVPKNNIKEYLQKVKQLQKEGLTPDEISEELKTLTKYPRFIDFTNYWYFDNRGLYCKDNLGGVKNGNLTPIMNPITNQLDPIPPGGFRYNSAELTNLTNQNRIHFHTDGSLPRVKRYLSENENQRPKSIMSDDQRPDYSMMSEFNTPFDNPKQLSFMLRILGLCDNDSIILDFFSGSATTAHAVMQLNAEDGGNRKFIMVQLQEKPGEKSEAYKAGYKNICEIGKERIRRAGAKIVEESKGTDLFTAEGNKLDIGFRVFKTDTTNMKDVYYSAGEVSQATLFGMESNIKEDRTDIDLLYGALLDWGVELSYPHTAEQIDGFTVHTVDTPATDEIDIIACFDENISEKAIREIASRKPLRALFRDHSFADSANKINVYEIFKAVAPDTSVKVM